MVGEASIRLDSPSALQQPCFLSRKYKIWIDTDAGPKVGFAAHGVMCSL